MFDEATLRANIGAEGGDDMKCILIAIVGCVMLSACATVKTSAPAPHAVARGVSYYLPRKDLKLAVERSVLKLDDAKKKVAAAQKAVDDAEAASKTAAAALKTQENLLPLLAAGSDAWKEVERARATAAAEKTLAASALSEAKAKLALAQAEQARIEAVAGAQCIYKYDTKLELLAAVPDHRMRFAANFAHNILRDDDGKLSVTSDGLLTSSNVAAADRTGDIIVELAGTIAGFGHSGISILNTGTKSVPDCSEAPGKFIYQFDPADFAEVNSRLIKAKFPLQLDLKGVEQQGPACLNPAQDDTKVKTVDRLARCASETIGAAGGKGALFYRSAVPVTVIVEQCEIAADGSVDCSNKVPVEASLVLIPQLGPISYIPMRSSAFVKTVDDVTFSNGSIVSWNASRPSEALEVVRLPVRILSAIVSVPAQILSLRVDVSDKEKALAATQQAQIEAQAKLAKLKACVTTAEQAGTSAEICFAE